MATWGVHLRVARCFIDNLIAKKYHREFVIGSVAPDCGYGVKDSFGEFTPPPKITHWSPSGMKRDCRYNDFQKEYLNDKSNADYWFYLGYYVHLLTDIMWSVTMYMPTRVKYAEEYKKNPEFLKVIKKDWNDIDVWHLRSLTYHPTFDILKNAGEIKDYLRIMSIISLQNRLSLLLIITKATVQIRTENSNIHKKKIFRILLNVHVNCFIKF